MTDATLKNLEVIDRSICSSATDWICLNPKHYGIKITELPVSNVGMICPECGEQAVQFVKTSVDNKGNAVSYRYGCKVCESILVVFEEV